MPGMPRLKGTYLSINPLSFWRLPPLIKVGGMETVKSLIFAIYSLLFRLGSSRFHVFIEENIGIVHICFESPSDAHMPWLDKRLKGTEIGGAYTKPSARGQGIYPFIINKIVLTGSGSTPFYMIVDERNEASVRGIEKAGFQRFENLTKERHFIKLPTYKKAP